VLSVIAADRFAPPGDDTTRQAMALMNALLLERRNRAWIPVLVDAAETAGGPVVAAFGAAHLGVAGNDVLMEFDYGEIYAPVDLNIGHCRLSVAEPESMSAQDDPTRWSHIRVATKYPNITRRHFERRGVQAECIKLNGAMELAPSMGLCRRIVDLVSTGSTLKANGLVEIETVAEVTSRLIVNRTALKTRPEEIGGWIDSFAKGAADAA
jgi:ATP phosphoribosyltransferase